MGLFFPLFRHRTVITAFESISPLLSRLLHSVLPGQRDAVRAAAHDVRPDGRLRVAQRKILRPPRHQPAIHAGKGYNAWHYEEYTAAISMPDPLKKPAILHQVESCLTRAGWEVRC